MCTGGSGDPSDPKACLAKPGTAEAGGHILSREAATWAWQNLLPSSGIKQRHEPPSPQLPCCSCLTSSLDLSTSRRRRCQTSLQGSGWQTAYPDHEPMKGRGASPSTLLASSLGSEENGQGRLKPVSMRQTADAVVLQAEHNADAKVGLYRDPNRDC